MTYHAWEAKIDTKTAKDRGINYQRERVIERIKSKSYYGESLLVVDEEALSIRMFEEDWKWFESFGYKVTRPTTTLFVPTHPSDSNHAMQKTTFGIISWEEDK